MLLYMENYTSVHKKQQHYSLQHEDDFISGVIPVCTDVAKA